MSDEEAEKTWRAWIEDVRFPDSDYDTFMAGRASRDAEVAALRERVAELEAVVEKAAATLCEPADFTQVLDTHSGRALWRAGRAVAGCELLLSTPPSTVLAAVKRETAAHALEQFADKYFGPVKPARNLYDAEMHIRARAAALRSGTEGSDRG